MTFRKYPSKVIQTTKSMLRGKLIEEPRWLKAAERFPNTGSYIRCSSAVAMDCPLPFEGRDRSTVTSYSLSSNLPITGRGSLNKTRFRPPVPPMIKYPEDELRREFFNDHPFELTRPVCLVEDDQATTSNWEAVLSDDKSIRISNEDVIMAQLKLISEGMSREEAYEKVTHELSQHRIYEEIEDAAAKKQAKHFGARLNKDAVQLGHEAEQINLEKSRVVIALNNALRNSNEFASEKSFKEEPAENSQASQQSSQTKSM
ncbi:mitochondrial ribosomal small subunit component [Entomophthora muscae]|uniref:Mitochondrial ribosomal small subunit component n=2 Tax=Entomophthora muscae TaxID=34485 RepID=A0ACC2S7S4_9FUNG|nr:mitochondrial ribosomal small subunit component [Entomophthora muscae]KAJ9061108.1 mitochondrial ribosomal small subunit component [Entomophthora muscae]